MDLRYGMNPHQRARITPPEAPPVRVIHGSPSLINYLDALNGWQLVREAAAVTGVPAAASFKHVSPAGAALAGDVDEAMRRAWDLGDGDVGAVTAAYVRARDIDPRSSFGDFVAVSEPVDRELADLLSGVVSDGIIAPGFAPGTVEILARKKRGTFLILEVDASYEPPSWEHREVFGMVLEQERDQTPITADLLRVVHGAALRPGTIRDALLGMVTLRYTQSNSVAYVKDGMTIGVGAGQQSRVDCTRLAGTKAGIWWLRRLPAIEALEFVEGMSRQDRLNWQVRLAEDGVTDSQWTALTAQVASLAQVTEVEDADRVGWLARLTEATLVSDGYIPFRDNIDHASRFGVRYVVEPGGSTRTGEVVEACRELGLTLIHTGTRLFHH
ncbi:phosphoribosylaminoimidazolecarboxamide formyltransferase [Rhodococcus sp. UNC363MFTsu5.1]|uniref:phosphoribosylaminoimidazolecarboxamide formyltransferase n=1 Tax=Rhodococcus sp. UNC363MFTsu5.1 TaxID=1449069 RepID=UPI000481F504|nr:phosphoribosylaminoimidazolecarboxamide formyltransferase [Rhodococcus sp. UNC363MFTsu5.1]